MPASGSPAGSLTSPSTGGATAGSRDGGPTGADDLVVPGVRDRARVGDVARDLAGVGRVSADEPLAIGAPPGGVATCSVACPGDPRGIRARATPPVATPSVMTTAATA